jgi:hypothetical protein
MAKIDYHKLHKELWNYLAVTGERHKALWPGWAKRRIIFNHCFACKVAIQRATEWQEMCERCPITWGVEAEGKEYNPSVACPCEQAFSPYMVWLLETRENYPDRKILKKLAAKVRDLPWTKKNSTP